MKTSEQINEVAAALAKAQGAMKPAIKDSTNPAFRSKYADLAAVWEAWHAVGPVNGIATVQDVTTEERGVAVITRLLHVSGQWLEFGPLTVPLAKFDAHGVGSATSYAKRYGLSAAVGVVAEEDDDGNQAAKGAPQNRGPYWQREEQRTAKGVPMTPPPAAPVSAPILEAERPAHIDADGVVTKPPTAAEAQVNGYAKVQERMKNWPAEIAAIIPPDEATFLMPEEEAEANRPLYLEGIRDMVKRRKVNPKERAELRMLFLGSPTADLDTANVYLLRAMWKYLDPERP